MPWTLTPVTSADAGFVLIAGQTRGVDLVVGADEGRDYKYILGMDHVIRCKVRHPSLARYIGAPDLVTRRLCLYTAGWIYMSNLWENLCRTTHIIEKLRNTKANTHLGRAKRGMINTAFPIVL